MLAQCLRQAQPCPVCTGFRRGHHSYLGRHAKPSAYQAEGYFHCLKGSELQLRHCIQWLQLFR